MLAELLYSFLPYQIFKSVFFRGGLCFVTTYMIIVTVMPNLIRVFRRKGITSDFVASAPQEGPYAGPKPIMGGGVLIVAIAISVLLWVDWNQFILALLLILVSFGVIGSIDDISKIRSRKRVDKGIEARKSYTDKADGISGRVRLLAEVVVATVVVLVLYRYVDIDGHLVVPFIPLDWWFPYLPRFIFIPFMVLIIVAGANAVNLTDGMDSLATVPIITCTLFIASVAYVGADPELSARLRVPRLSPELRELIIVSAAVISAGLAFLQFNAPPAMITMGDMGALALGSMFSAMFIFAKAELFLPLVGGVLVLTTISTIVQRLYFKVVLWRKGREAAEKHRFFYRAPYHHHLQTLWTYTKEPPQITSIWVEFQKKLGIHPPGPEDQLMRKENVDSRVVWRLHMMSVLLFVLALVVYFKVR